MAYVVTYHDTFVTAGPDGQILHAPLGEILESGRQPLCVPIPKQAGIITAGPLAGFHYTPLTGAAFSLQKDGFYLCAEPASPQMLWDRPQCAYWESFRFADDEEVRALTKFHKAKLTIGVLGNCQSDFLAICIRALLPSARVFTRRITEPPGPILEALDSCDLVISIPAGTNRGPLATRQMRKQFGDRLQMTPSFGFTGFHPDILNFGLNPKQLRSPVAAYHSTIAILCYLRKMPLADAEYMFNAYVYGRLGYFEEYERSVAALTAICAELGYDIGPAIANWRKRSGCFMLTNNHPRICVMEDLAKMVLAKFGVSIETDLPLTEILPDRSTDHEIWPCYPEIADRLGIAGSYRFKLAVWDTEQFLDLREFLRRCYHVYSFYAPEDLAGFVKDRQALFP